MKNKTLILTVVGVATLIGSMLPSYQPAQASNLYSTMTWHDEFSSGKTVDPTYWTMQTGNSGWGNGELETYTNSRNNVKVANGLLTITALYNASTGQYTSGRVVTMNKKSFMYGRLDVRAKLPVGLGSWPAIWLYPQGSKYGSAYLANGELDIMEEVGADPNQVSSSTHSQGYNPSLGNTRFCSTTIPTANSAFHTYSVEWSPSYMAYLIDGAEYCRVNNDYTGYLSWPYDQPYFLVMNLAVGGSWGGYKGVDPASMPWNFQIDYVRLYQ